MRGVYIYNTGRGVYMHNKFKDIFTLKATLWKSLMNFSNYMKDVNLECKMAFS